MSEEIRERLKMFVRRPSAFASASAPSTPLGRSVGGAAAAMANGGTTSAVRFHDGAGAGAGAGESFCKVEKSYKMLVSYI